MNVWRCNYHRTNVSRKIIVTFERIEWDPEWKASLDVFVPRARRAIFSSPFYVLFPLLSSLPSVCARLSGSLFRSSPAISVMSAWPCEPHKRKWHFCVPVTNASRNNFVFFVDYLLRDSFPRRNFWPLSLPSRVQGRGREREREISGNKRIKKYRDRRIREVLSVRQEV